MTKKSIKEEILRQKKLMGLNEIYDDQEDLNDPTFDPWKGAGGQYPVYEKDQTNGVNLDEYFDEVGTTTPYGEDNGVITPEFVAEKNLRTDDDHAKYEKQLLIQKFLETLDSNVHELDMLKKILYEKGLYNKLLKYKANKITDQNEINNIIGEIKHLVNILELPDNDNVKEELLTILNKLSDTNAVPAINNEEAPIKDETVTAGSCPCEEMSEVEGQKYNQPDYKYYVINKNIDKIMSGWEFREDGIAFIKDIVNGGGNPKEYVLSSLKYAKMRGIDPNNNDSWGNPPIKSIDPVSKLDEIKPVKQPDQIYFDTFSGSIQYAMEKMTERGLLVEPDDVYEEVNLRDNRRPKEGETTHLNLPLYKDGKIQRKMLHIQIYNRGNNVGNNFELNYYVS